MGCTCSDDARRHRGLDPFELKQSHLDALRGRGRRLGCPRQETFVYECQGLLDMPLLAVGAAFDFHAGTTSQAPSWMQRWGLEWLFRLLSDPRRLWRRYLVLGFRYVLLVFVQKLVLRTFDPGGHRPHADTNVG